MNCEIAGIRIEFDMDFTFSLEKLAAYSSEYKSLPDLIISARGYNSVNKPIGTLLLDDIIKWYAGNDDKVIACLNNSLERDIVFCRLDVDREWKNAAISYLEVPCIENIVTGLMGNTIFRNLIILHQGVILHSSVIKWNGKGIAFTAPPGTGKSTHTRLWENYFGASVLNDDTPAIRLTDRGVTVYGTPWSGSGTNVNDCAPLSAIVILEQSQENSIRILTVNEAIPRLIPRFLLPYHDAGLMKTAIDYIESIVSTVPVFHLNCRPDREAADLVFDSIGKIHIVS